MIGGALLPVKSMAKEGPKRTSPLPGCKPMPSVGVLICIKPTPVKPVADWQFDHAESGIADHR
jgi:hypothetical protein